MGLRDSESRLWASSMTWVPFLTMKYIRTQHTTQTMIIQGFTIEIITTTVAVLKKPWMVRMLRIGMTRSNTIRSLEKRVTMRPIGFESKKRMLARSTRLVIALCRFVAPLRMKWKIVIDLNTVQMTKRPINTPKMIGYNYFCYSSRFPPTHFVSQREGRSWRTEVIEQMMNRINMPNSPSE